MQYVDPETNNLCKKSKSYLSVEIPLTITFNNCQKTQILTVRKVFMYFLHPTLIDNGMSKEMHVMVEKYGI